MPPPQKRHGASWVTVLVVLMLGLTFTSATTTPASARNTATLVRRQSAGSSCAGSEGQWNCMTDSFQRCGSGQWSVVEQCAAGTQCSPSGLTYEFHVDFADGYIGAAPPPTSGGGGRPTAVAAGRVFGGGGGLINWWFLAVLGVFAVRLA